MLFFVKSLLFSFIDIPNASRGLVRLPFRLEWEQAFLKYLKELDKQKPVVWCGDLNVAHNRIDLRNPDTNGKSAGFTKEERECFTKILSEGFIDSFRHLYPDKEEAYTFWSYFNGARGKNVGWRLDYFVLSERLKENLVESTMRTSQKGSDHCPIVLQMNL
jgi:exodeoxyribonuclease III